MYTNTQLNIIIDGWDVLMKRQAGLAQTRSLPGYCNPWSELDDMSEPWFSFENRGGQTVKVSFTGTRYEMSIPNGALPILSIKS